MLHMVSMHTLFSKFKSKSTSVKLRLTPIIYFDGHIQFILIKTRKIIELIRELHLISEAYSKHCQTFRWSALRKQLAAISMYNIMSHQQQQELPEILCEGCVTKKQVLNRQNHGDDTKLCVCFLHSEQVNTLLTLLT